MEMSKQNFFLGFYLLLNNWIDDWDYHSYGAMTLKIEKLKILAAIKERALSSTERANDIICNEIAKLEDDNEVMLDLPHITSMRDSIRRARNTKDGLVPGRAENIPEVLRFDVRGDPFLDLTRVLVERIDLLFYFPSLSLIL